MIMCESVKETRATSLLLSSLRLTLVRHRWCVSGGTKVLVTNLDPEITESELRDLFETVGQVRSVSIRLDSERTKVSSLYRRLLLVSPLTHSESLTLTYSLTHLLAH